MNKLWKRRKTIDYKKEYERYKALYEDVLKDNEVLAKENEMQKRKIYGLEKTVSNLKEKQEKLYRAIR